MNPEPEINQITTQKAQCPRAHATGETTINTQEDWWPEPEINQVTTHNGQCMSMPQGARHWRNNHQHSRGLMTQACARCHPSICPIALSGTPKRTSIYHSWMWSLQPYGDRAHTRKSLNTIWKLEWRTSLIYVKLLLALQQVERGEKIIPPIKSAQN